MLDLEITIGSQSIESSFEKEFLSNGDEVIQQLKDKFANTSDSDERYRILTTLPRSWSVYRIEKEFAISHFLAKRAKELQQQEGIMSTPVKRLSRSSLGEDALLRVRDFFNSDEVSRACPGKRDYIVTTNDQGKQAIQRRLVMCNLKEAYEIFKREHPAFKIGFSMFASHRPKNCILAGSSGTHTVCVCIYHQNVKLMFKALHDRHVTWDSVTSYHDLFLKIVCKNPSEKCFLKKCQECPGPDNLSSELNSIFFNSEIESLKFKQWRQADRCTMDQVEVECQEFVDEFVEKVNDLLPHNFIADQQSNYLKYLKENLTSSECIIICDFSENLSFVVQDAVQGFHWANSQCTIHPFAIYYKDSDSQDIQFTSFIAIAEFTKHNHVAVRLFLKKCIEFIKNKLPELTMIHFFSDGSGSQYKNKMTAFNLCQMEKDFQIKAEWHFFATCHGKGPCDALGGVLKRNATKASLQGKLITTAEELYTWAISKPDSKINYAYFSEKHFQTMEKKLKSRYTKVKQISGTQSFHSFRPLSENYISVKRFSFSTEEIHVKL